MTVLTALVLLASACGGGRDDDEGGSGGDDEGEESGGPPEEVPGFDGETIRLGVITPTSGRVAVIGEPLTNGNRAYW